jgi:hypothetical protein
MISTTPLVPLHEGLFMYDLALPSTTIMHRPFIAPILLAFSLLLAPLSACQRSRAPEVSLTVQLTDSNSGQPIDSAILVITEIDPRHPLSIRDNIRPPINNEQRTTTNAAGIAMLPASPGTPYQITAIKPGYQPDSWYLDNPLIPVWTLRLTPTASPHTP